MVQKPSMDWPEEKESTGSTGWCQCAHSSFDRWTYSYMKHVLNQGGRSYDLTQDDLFRAPSRMKAAHVSRKFLKTFYEHQDGHNNNNNGGSSMLRALWTIIAPLFVPAGFCQLLTVFAQVSIPLLVRRLLVILEERSTTTTTTTEGNNDIFAEGLPYVLLIFVASTVNAFGTHRHAHLAVQSGITVRAAVVCAIYEHALHLSPRGRAGLTNGEVTNLVATDSQKIFEVLEDGHLLWSCPLSMAIVTVLLLFVMGPTTIVGMSILFLLLPTVKCVTTRLIAVRRRRIAQVDQRVETVSAMLQGIKVAKLNHYEHRYRARLEATRRAEIKILRSELFLWAVTMVLIVSTPIIASAATFATYVFVYPDRVLTASTTFSVLILFSALRFPINFVGRLVGRIGQAYQASRRISDFLCRERQPPSSHDSTGNRRAIHEKEEMRRPAVQVEGASFAVGQQVNTCPLQSVGAAAATDEKSTISHTDEEESTNSNNRANTSGIFTLSNISFSIYPRQTLAVVGPTGCGKSTLVKALLGDVEITEGTVMLNTDGLNDEASTGGGVAYASQTPFILNATIRENIIFGLPMDEDFYGQVLFACCLEEDLRQFQEGDLTEIGERGVTLSGGQKQRISLARVAYSRPAIVLLDDPLSALDASTCSKVFDRLLSSKSGDGVVGGLLSTQCASAVVLVTHAVHFLQRVDQVMVIADGDMPFVGSWEGLLSFNNSNENNHSATAIIDFMSSVFQEGSDLEDVDGNHITSFRDGVNVKTEAKKDTSVDVTTSMLMTKEKREHGQSSLRMWAIWFKYAGGWKFVVCQFVLLFLDRSAYVATEFWLAKWTQAHDGPVDIFGMTFPSQVEGMSAQYRYLEVYAGIILFSVFATFLRSEWAVTGGIRCATSLFSEMVSHVLAAPMSYFDTTPLGRILNRFTYDVEVLDIELVQAMARLMICSSWFLAAISVMVSIMPYSLCVLIPVTFSFFMLLNYYRKTGADLRRLDAVSRSPLQAMLAEGLDGATVIRVFKQENRFQKAFETSMDVNSSAMLNFVSAQRWMALRTEMLGAIIVLTSCLLLICLNEKMNLEAGIAAMLIIWSSNLTITLSFTVQSSIEAEAAITSVERIHSLSNLPKERSMITDPANQVDKSWPSQGALEYDGLCVRYRDNLPLALNGLSFKIKPGQRCGVVGRTGSGKTTLTSVLFRLIEAEAGRILLDGVDLATLGLEDVRGRPNAMVIIPQDPFLIAGNLRDCLDPFRGSTDEQVVEALNSVRLMENNSDRASVLRTRVDEGGANFSTGERQLICLARAILTKPKLLVLDEATASVDGETDIFIQEMIRTRFKDTTLLTVAHRLNTIIDYDLIIVMDEGKAVEIGSPKSLLESDVGVFTELVNSTGIESAAALKAMVL